MRLRNTILVVIAIFFVTIMTITAATEAKVQFFNGNLTTATNTLYINFKLVNTGTDPITLSNAKLRYYFNNDGTQSNSFACDWAKHTFTPITSLMPGVAVIIWAWVPM